MTTTTSLASIFATMKDQSRGLVTAMSDMGTKTRDGLADTGTKMRAGGGGGSSGGFISGIADAGAKTLLKTDMAFLERDMKSRKQTFGIVAYDILKGGSSEVVSEVPLPAELQTSYEAAHGDIQALDAKLTLKKNELPASGSGLVGFSSAVLLKTDMAFIERDMKSRKQAFGIIAYDILKSSTPTQTLSAELQKSFDEARGDIQAIEAKLVLKRNEMQALDNPQLRRPTSNNDDGVGGEDAEAPGIPSV